MNRSWEGVRRRAGWRSAILVGLLWWWSASGNLPAADPVTAELAQESAWTGEGVSLVITLYSPGPFSGTATFEFPELSQTVLIRGDSPVVGSESMDGVTYFTQRHEVTVYTQRNGRIVIPSFQVRFAGKKTFTSAPEPIEGVTPELTFQSKRPPGTDSLGFVLTASDMQVAQSWSPEVVETLRAGDVIERTITRKATGTTAMMMSPIEAVAPPGGRVYVGEPMVQDRSDRGDVSAQRRDTLKYQFGHAGTFTLADIPLVWWDANASELKSEILRGKTIRVAGEPDAMQLPIESESNSGAPSLGVLYAVSAVSICIGVACVWMLIPRLIGSHRNPESDAAERLLAACRDDDASGAYAALLHWKRTVGLQDTEQRLESFNALPLSGELERLTRRLFRGHARETVWTGVALASAFRQSRRAVLERRSPGRARHRSLPDLNPIDLKQRSPQ
ncbi:BatD family protein [Stieleria mannarensis]|uniref:BatD family protein n=1 Tax=Stieleria mannarensis TaxID=2755585 RepID=UPI0015FF05CE|nr:BatD family protein [Rhodopirellula sp. JC639]